MAISILCPCGTRLRVKEESTGKRVRCPSCGQMFVAQNPPKSAFDSGHPDLATSSAPPAVAVSYNELVAASPQPALPPSQFKLDPLAPSVHQRHPQAITSRTSNRAVGFSLPHRRFLVLGIAGAGGLALMAVLAIWFVAPSNLKVTRKPQVASAAATPSTWQEPTTNMTPDTTRTPERRAETQLERPPDPAELAIATLAKGGGFWSSPTQYQVSSSPGIGPVYVTAGDGLMIWPAEDKPYGIAAGKQQIRFQWRLRPGQSPLTGDLRAQGKLHHDITGNRFQTSIMGLQLRGGPTEGTLEIEHDFSEAASPNAVLWIETDAVGKSNLIVLQIDRTPAAVAAP